MRIPPLLTDFIHDRVCKPNCEKMLTLPFSWPGDFLFYLSIKKRTEKIMEVKTRNQAQKEKISF